MENLPSDVIEKIVRLLPYDGLAQYSTISRKWQKEIEKRTFESISLSSDPENWTQFFLCIVCRPQTRYRRLFIRTLKYTVVLPFGETSLPHHETMMDPRTDTLLAPWKGNPMDLHFEATNHIKKLFDLLERCDQYDKNEKTRTGGSDGLTLELGWVKTPIDNDPQQRKQGGFKLLVPKGAPRLPEINCVSRLKFHYVPIGPFFSPKGRSLAPGAAIVLSRVMPKMKRFSIVSEGAFHYPPLSEAPCLIDLDHRYKAKRHRHDRGDFMEVLTQTEFQALQSCTEAAISLEDRVGDTFAGLGDGDPFFYQPAGYDKLSQAIRLWSQNLVSLDISGLFSSTLFWPEPSEPSVKSPTLSEFWPKLKNLHVKFLCMTPAGSYFFDNESVGWFPWHPCRNVPVDDSLNLLFRAWVRALDRMPVLEQASVRWSLDFEVKDKRTQRDWLVAFQAPGTSLDPSRHAWEANVSDELRKSPRVTFQNDSEWRPDNWTMMQLYAVAVKMFPETDMIELSVDKDCNVTVL
ncbi:hypothetical protein GGR53DRAFT_465338 [Hypoxylon sp. FL1150]|nr:hypothetical protein GGR53DRAFT_465338 [Hypoxylon sp. FL1150]